MNLTLSPTVLYLIKKKKGGKPLSFFISHLLYTRHWARQSDCEDEPNYGFGPVRASKWIREIVGIQVT